MELLETGELFLATKYIQTTRMGVEYLVVVIKIPTTTNVTTTKITTGSKKQPEVQKKAGSQRKRWMNGENNEVCRCYNKCDPARSGYRE